MPNPDQKDTDADTYGDVCESDDDDDYDLDHVDNCPLTPNPDQADADGDGDRRRVRPARRSSRRARQPARP